MWGLSSAEHVRTFLNPALIRVVILSFLLLLPHVEQSDTVHGEIQQHGNTTE